MVRSCSQMVQHHVVKEHRTKCNYMRRNASTSPFLAGCPTFTSTMPAKPTICSQPKAGTCEEWSGWRLPAPSQRLRFRCLAASVIGYILDLQLSKACKGHVRKWMGGLTMLRSTTGQFDADALSAFPHRSGLQGWGYIFTHFLASVYMFYNSCSLPGDSVSARQEPGRNTGPGPPHTMA